jgi:superfamily II DNA or RNA helicase
MTTDLVQVGMVKTVARRLEAIPAPALLVIDEAHHAVAGTWAKIPAAYPSAKVLGVTATPERLDGVGLRDAFDTMVIGPDVRELIDDGHLARSRYLAPDTDVDLSGVRSTGGDYNAGDLERAVDQDSITGEHSSRSPPITKMMIIAFIHASHEDRSRCQHEAGSGLLLSSRAA